MDLAPAGTVSQISVKIDGSRSTYLLIIRSEYKTRSAAGSQSSIGTST